MLVFAWIPREQILLLEIRQSVTFQQLKKLREFLSTSNGVKWLPFNCNGFIKKPNMGKGSIKIASPQNATRQLNWLPTYTTLFENWKLTHYRTEEYSR